MHPQDRLARVVRLCFSRTETCCRSETTDDSTHESIVRTGLDSAGSRPTPHDVHRLDRLCGYDETVDHGRPGSERLSRMAGRSFRGWAAACRLSQFVTPCSGTGRCHITENPAGSGHTKEFVVDHCSS